MKGCFLLQRGFAFIGHHLVALLQKEYGLTEFCGYVYMRSGYDFLRTQTEIPYSALLLDEDIYKRFRDEPLDHAYLARLEHEIGLPSLWPYLTVDRVFLSGQLVHEYPYDQCAYTHEELMQLVQTYAKTIEAFLDAEKPDYVFGSVIGGLGSYLLFEMAKKRGIKTFLVLMASTKNRYMITESPFCFTYADQAMTQRDTLRTSPFRTEARAFLEAFRATPTPYYDKSTPSAQPVSRAKQFRFLSPAHALRALRIFWPHVLKHFQSQERFDYSYVGPWRYLRDWAKRKIRNLRGADDLYDAPNPHEAYAFFPLHYEPEISLLLQAPEVIDQTILIRQVARALPLHMKLYVKEHPEMVPFRPRRFYKALKKMPNVKLLPPWTSSFQITPHAQLITTITGSTGWEALLFGRPVMSFGKQFYNSLSGVTRCTDMEQLPRIIQERLRTPVDEEEVLDFLTAIFQESAELNLHHLWIEEKNPERQREGVRPLAASLAHRLGVTRVSSPTR